MKSKNSGTPTANLTGEVFALVLRSNANKEEELGDGDLQIGGVSVKLQRFYLENKYEQPSDVR